MSALENIPDLGRFPLTLGSVIVFAQAVFSCFFLQGAEGPKNRLSIGY